MSNYDDTNRGALFRNDKKETDRHPDYTGKINIDGTDKRLAAWIKESRNGTKYMSLSVSDFQATREAAGQDAPMQQDPDSDIPF